VICTKNLVYIALLGGVLRSKFDKLPHIYDTRGAWAPTALSPGVKLNHLHCISIPPLHFYSIFKLDQHQPSMIFSYRPLKKNLGAPGPGPAYENAGIGHLSPISNLPCTGLNFSSLEMTEDRTIFILL